MFDDQKLQTSETPITTVTETVSAVPKTQLAHKKASKLVIAIIVVLVLVVLAAIALVVVKSDLLNIDREPMPNNNEVATPAASTVETVVETPEVTTPAIDMTIIDTDGDGLTDVEEIELGTDYNNLDSDGDGLTDSQEVKKYDIDPLNKDTDGDTYSDGEEVKNGYNPNGAGKLLNLN